MRQFPVGCTYPIGHVRAHFVWQHLLPPTKCNRPKFYATSFYISFHVLHCVCFFLFNYRLPKLFLISKRFFFSLRQRRRPTRKKQCQTGKMLSKKFCEMGSVHQFVWLRRSFTRSSREFASLLVQLFMCVYILFFYLQFNGVILELVSIVFVAKCDNLFNNGIHTKRLCSHHFLHFEIVSIWLIVKFRLSLNAKWKKIRLFSLIFIDSKCYAIKENANAKNRPRYMWIKIYGNCKRTSVEIWRNFFAMQFDGTIKCDAIKLKCDAKWVSLRGGTKLSG